MLKETTERDTTKKRERAVKWRRRCWRKKKNENPK